MNHMYLRGFAACVFAAFVSISVIATIDASPAAYSSALIKSAVGARQPSAAASAAIPSSASSKLATSTYQPKALAAKSAQPSRVLPFESVPVISGNIAPNAIEIEEGQDGHATQLGTNLYPRDLLAYDPELAVEQFAVDALYNFLGLGSMGLFNNPWMNDDGSIKVDWVKDTLVNNDAPSVVNGVAEGIITTPANADEYQTGVAYNGVKRGHWNGARIADSVAGGERDQFVKGGKENDPTTWQIEPSSVGSGKYDITQAFLANSVYTVNTTNKNVLFFGMERRSNNGTTAFDFEFNAEPPLDAYRPNRSDGDVRFTFEMQGGGKSGSVLIKIAKWNAATTTWVELDLNSLPAGLQPIANINRVETPSTPWGYVNSQGNWVIGQIPKYQVAEAAVYFGPGTGILEDVSGCGGSAFVQVRTRASSTENSDLKDTTKIFEYLFGGPTADLTLSSTCDQSFTYAPTGSEDSTGGTNLTYKWQFDAPEDVTLTSTDAEFGPDPEAPGDATRYAATFTDADPRSVDVVLPEGADYADIDVMLTAIEGSGCEDATDVFTVRVWRKLEVEASLSAPCSDNYAIGYSSTVTGGKSPYSYEWTFYKQTGGGDVEVGTRTDASGTFNATEAGTYYAVLEVTDTADDASGVDEVEAKVACDDTDTADAVSVYAPISVDPDLTGSCDSRDIAYSSTVSGGDGNYTYLWKFYKDGGATPVETRTDASGTFTPTEDGDYTATLEVTDGVECVGEEDSNEVTALGPMNPSVEKTSADWQTLAVTMTGTWHEATVEWQVRESSSGTWTTISGETAATLIFSAFETYDTTPEEIAFSNGGFNYVGMLYKVDIRIKTSRTHNGGCEDFSDPVTITKIIAVDP